MLIYQMFLKQCVTNPSWQNKKLFCHNVLQISATKQLPEIQRFKKLCNDVSAYFRYIMVLAKSSLSFRQSLSCVQIHSSEKNCPRSH